MKIHASLPGINGTLMTGKTPIPWINTTIRMLRENYIPYRHVSDRTRKSRMSVLKK